MSELKHKMFTRSSKQPQPQPESRPSSTQKQQQKPKSKPKNNGQKKPLQQQSLTSMFKKKENQIIAEPIEILYSIKQLLKTTSLADILENCPKIKSLYELLCSQRCVSQKLVFACLDKYFHGNTTSLWAYKYGPRTLSELFQSDFAEKIQQWIKDFYYFRKDDGPVGSDLQFIDDQPEQSYSKSLQIRMVENGWNCKGLVLKGRSGVGKTSFLNAIAKSMRIRCFQYASDVDQLQKMKQMFDGSQSQCVNNYQIKKQEQINNKIIRKNSSITKFISAPVQKKEDLETKQPRRMQIFRNFSNYFAPFQKSDKQGAQDSYLRQLFQSINKSQIPYVLTTDRHEFTFREKSSNENFSKLDQIQFQQNKTQDLTYLYWTIYQIEYNLQLNNTKKIKKQQLFNQLNAQFQSIHNHNQQFKCLDILHLIRQLVVCSNKKPLYIAKYLQFRVFNRDRFQGGINLDRCFQDAIERIGGEVVGKVDADGLIYNVQWNLYNKVCEEVNPLEQTAAQQAQKSQKSDKQEQKLQSKQIEFSSYSSEKKPSLREMRHKLEIKTYEDHRVFKNEYFHYRDQEQRTPGDHFASIPIQTHLKSKRTIVKNIKNRILISMQQQRQKKKPYIKLKQKQLFYLPMMFPSKRISSRTLRKQNQEVLALEQNLLKIMNQRQLAYMYKFNKFVHF